MDVGMICRELHWTHMNTVGQIRHMGMVHVNEVPMVIAKGLKFQVLKGFVSLFEVPLSYRLSHGTGDLDIFGCHIDIPGLIKVKSHTPRTSFTLYTERFRIISNCRCYPAAGES